MSTKIKRACYGLVDAPLEWYRTVDAFLQSIGMERCSSDACMWCYREQGELKGLISGHVDDFIFGGDDSHQGWCDRLKQIQEKFRWGDWETDKFTQCGVLIESYSSGFLPVTAFLFGGHLGNRGECHSPKGQTSRDL